MTQETILIHDIVGRIEAEEIVGVRPRTFARLLAEGKLPFPIRTLKDGTRLWAREDIEVYAATRERFVEAGA